MGIFSRNSIIFTIGIGLPLICHAENWEAVYTQPDPENIVVYVDTDSASRKGDIATIYERIGVGPKALQTYDCVRKKVFGSWNEKKLNELNEKTTPSFEKACKSFWEFWK